jgi:hypothetical protein
VLRNVACQPSGDCCTAAKLKLKEFPVCIRACDDTLELDPHNVKAYYRYRALKQALCSSPDQ